MDDALKVDAVVEGDLKKDKEKKVMVATEFSHAPPLPASVFQKYF